MKNGFRYVILGVALLLLASCSILPEKGVSEIYDSSLSSRTLDPEVISDIRWAQKWGSYFETEAGPSSTSGDANEADSAAQSTPMVEFSVVLTEMAKRLEGSEKGKGSERGVKLAGKLKLAATDLRDSADKGLLYKYRLGNISGLMREYVQVRLSNWIDSDYKDIILGMLHPRSLGVIEDVVFESYPLAKGLQTSDAKFHTVASLAKSLSSSYKHDEKANLTYKEGTPRMFEVLYILSEENISKLFTYKNFWESRKFDHIPYWLGFSPMKRLWLSGVPLRFVYFPEVAWMHEKTQILSLGTPGTPAELVALIKDAASSKDKEMGSAISVSFEGKEDKTLSYSLSPPIRASDSAGYCFCYVRYRVQSGGSGPIRGWESRLTMDDFHAPYELQFDGEAKTISVTRPFFLYRLVKEEDCKGDARAKLGEGLDSNRRILREACLLNDESVLAIFALQSDYFGTTGRDYVYAHPLAFIKTSPVSGKPGCWSVEQLINISYSLKDVYGAGERFIPNHPANNLRIKVQLRD